MMKLKQLLTEEELDRVLIKVLNIMLKMGFDPEEISDNYDNLEKDLHIKDGELKGEAVLYYRKYHDVAEEKGSFTDIGEVNLEYNEDEIENEIMALAQHLDIHPLLIEKSTYGGYNNVLTGDEYSVLDENSADDEFRARAEEYIEETLEYSDDIGWLDSYLEMDRYYVEQFCDDDANYRVDDMDEDEIIEEMGAEDELERRLEVARRKSDRWHELDEEISDIQDKIEELTKEIEDLNEEMYEIRSEASSSQDREEIEDLKIQYEELEETMLELEESLEYWDGELEEKDEEFESLDGDDDLEWRVKEELADELKDDLGEKISEQMFDNIEYEGWEYFKDNFGYTAKQIIDNGWFDIDRDSAIDSLESDRGNIMSSYDGVEYEEDYNGETYFIYQTN